jgi:membrane protease YdiL (CAAX protease family)
MFGSGSRYDLKPNPAVNFFGCKFTHLKIENAMIDKNSRNLSFPSQLGVFLGLMGAGLIAGGVISLIIWVAMTGRPVLSLATDMTNPRYFNAIMAIQVCSTITTFFLPVYFFARICYRNPLQFLGFNARFNYKQVAMVIGLLILTFPLSAALAEINNLVPIPKDWATKFKKWEKAREVQEAALINLNSFFRYFISMIGIALFPALLEEVCFRGGLQNILTRWFKGPWIAIILTAIIFSAVHGSYYGFLVRFVLGMILGLVFYYSGSLWLSIIIHFLYNGLQVTAMYVLTVSGKKDSAGIEDHFPIWAGVIALILILFIFVQFRKASLEQQQKYVYEPPEDPDDFSNWTTKEF